MSQTSRILAVVPSHPASSSRHEGEPWRQALALALALATMIASVILAQRILFSSAAFGGTWGLFTMYAETVAIGVALAALRALYVRPSILRGDDQLRAVTFSDPGWTAQLVASQRYSG
jgi:hypothetical protein